MSYLPDCAISETSLYQRLKLKPKVAMAERKKPRGRKAADSMKVETPLTKEEKAIIHWVRKNVATKTTKFLHSHKVGK